MSLKFIFKRDVPLMLKTPNIIMEHKDVVTLKKTYRKSAAKHRYKRTTEHMPNENHVF